MSVALEIAVQDPDGIAAAAHGGADRIELCTALALGGLTPPAGLIAAAVAAAPSVHVLVRPRSGGFDYGPAEAAVLLDDVRRALDAGARGVVVGALRHGRVDAGLVSRIRSLAGTAELTFHRAFDTVDDRDEALDQLIDLGVDRLLTSGGASRATEGLDDIANLVMRAAGRLQVMAGAGIDVAAVAPVVATGVAAIHASAKRAVQEVHRVDLGSLERAGATARGTTDEGLVRALRSALDQPGRAR